MAFLDTYIKPCIVGRYTLNFVLVKYTFEAYNISMVKISLNKIAYSAYEQCVHVYTEISHRGYGSFVNLRLKFVLHSTPYEPLQAYLLLHMNLWKPTLYSASDFPF